jgi:hypothetical protein
MRYNVSYLCIPYKPIISLVRRMIIFSLFMHRTPLRLAQLVFPDASVFFDIGANRGYFTAKIFNLWSPGHGLNGKTLSNAIKADFYNKITTNKDNVIGVCEDTFTFQPMVCVGRSSITTAFGPMAHECQFRRAIKVISFDGQESHVHDQRKTIYKHFPYLHPNYKGIFSISVLDINKYQYNSYTIYFIPILLFIKQLTFLRVE